MSQYDNANRGVLFPNYRKTGKQPDHRGEIFIAKDVLKYILDNARSGEVKIRLAAWNRTTQKGDEMLSLAAEVPEDQAGQARERAASRREEPPVFDNTRAGYQDRPGREAPRGRRNDFDDEIPF